MTQKIIVLGHPLSHFLLFFCKNQLFISIYDQFKKIVKNKIEGVLC